MIRATTTAVTAVAAGRRCFVAPTIDAAVALAAEIEGALLVGEVGGHMPYGFDLTNSPVAVGEPMQDRRPLVLVSSSGTPLIAEAETARRAYVGSLRGCSALVDHLTGSPDPVAIVGAGTRGEFRVEDELCCAWIAGGMLDRGFAPADNRTAEIVARRRGDPVDVIRTSASAEYLRRTGQLHDLEFVLTHVDDLAGVYGVEGGEVVEVKA